jgi:hypothetical protein
MGEKNIRKKARQKHVDGKKNIKKAFILLSLPIDSRDVQ